MPTSPDKYELDERAAIRQYDAGTEKDKAEGLAKDDIKRRGKDNKSRIKELRRRVSELTGLIAKERNMQRSEELMNEWTRLRMLIIDLKEELKNGNGRRIPG